MLTKTLSAGSIIALAALALTLFTLVPEPAFAQTEAVLHAFQSTNKYDGFNPNATLIASPSGVLYGTTGTGGLHGFGTVFELVPPASPGGAWTQHILYSFTGNADGGEPAGGPLLLKNGTLYGTTQVGGANQVGAVFELTPGNPWVETVIYSFVNGPSGFTPASGLTLGSKGTLYGTTVKGGAHKLGVVYRLSPPAVGGTTWTEAPIYAFKGGSTDGYEPVNNMIFDSAGALYGTTQGGQGTVYKLTPSGSGPWTESVLYFFNGSSDGGFPNSSLVLDAAGNLYGATTSGGSTGGNIFQLTPPSGGTGLWTENILYAFQGTPGNDGADPNGTLFDSTGAIYGTTQYGGTNSDCGVVGCGTVFKLMPPSAPGGTWTEQLLYSFQSGSDGAYPIANLIELGGTFYGTTASGGGNHNAGTAFSFAP